MNERLPYEESLKQKLQEIPLPEMEPSWQKMKELLKEKEDNRILPPFFSGCAIIGLAVLLTIAGFWLYKNKYSEKNKSVVEVTVNKIPTENSQHNADSKIMSVPKGKADINIQNLKADSVSSGISGNIYADSISETTSTKNNSKNNSTNNSTVHQSINKKSINDDVVSGLKIKSRRKKKLYYGSKKSMAVTASRINEGEKNTNNKRTSKRKTIPAKTNMQVSIETPKADSVFSDKEDTIIVFKTDSVIIKVDAVTKNADTTLVADSMKEASAKKEKKKSKYYFAAGLSLQHQLPVNGQKSNNYDAFGRKNSWKDYIPSPYIRFYKMNKWFLHTGFRYGAPQSVKEMQYASQNSRDTSSGQIFSIRSNYVVRKTFYHQVPLSFNIMITPKLSVGTGIMYSVFNGALTEKETIKFVYIQGIDSVISQTKEFVKVPSSGDSFFTRTQFNFTLQAEFHWRRFGFGAQYTKGLQPYLKYAEAGVLKKVKNESLQIFIRYELWKGANSKGLTTKTQSKTQRTQ